MHTHADLLKSLFTLPHKEKGESVLPVDNFAFSGSVLPFFVIHISLLHDGMWISTALSVPQIDTTCVSRLYETHKHCLETIV